MREGKQTWVYALVCMGSFCTTGLQADETSIPQDSKSAGFRLQESDPEILPLKPKVEQTPEEKARLDALSWVMTGRLLETRQDLRRAYEAYKKAVALDPNSSKIYQALVPLAFRLNQIEEAVSYAEKAVELDPDDVELLQQLATHVANQRRLPEAIGYLEQASRSSKLNKKSPSFVLLMRSLGILYVVTDQKEKAAEAYAEVLEALKNSEAYGLDFRTRRALLTDQQTSFERIGEVLLDGKKVQLAEEAFDLAEKSGRVSAGNLHFHRARVLLASDKAAEALDQLQEYLDAQRQTKGRTAYELLAEILKKLDRSGELVTRLQALAEKDPRNKILQYYYAEQLAEAGNFEGAKEVYQKSLDGAGDPQGYLGLASVLRQLKQSDELLDTLGLALAKVSPETAELQEAELRAISEDKDLLAAMIAAGRQQAKAEPSKLAFEEAYLLGKLAAEVKQVDESVEFFRLALPLSGERLFLIYSELADVYSDNRRYEEAAEVYSEALKEPALAERRPDLLLFQSQALEMSDQTEKALSAVAEALKIVPGHPRLQFQQAWIYYHSHQWDQAIQHFEEILKDHADEPGLVRMTQFSLSNIYVQQGDIRKGEEILEKVLAEDPEDPSVNNDLGYLYADQGKNLEQAEEMIRKAIASEPENAAYLDSLGWVLFKRGKAEEALPYLEKSIAKSAGAGDATLYDHLGDCLHALKRTPEAITAWKKALEDAKKNRFPDAKLVERLEQKLKEQSGQESDSAQKASAKPS